MDPAQQRGIVWHGGEVDAAARPPHQAIRHKLLGCLVAPVIQALDHQPAQDDLHGRRWPPTGGRIGGTPPPVGFDPLQEHILFQPSVKLGQEGIHRQAEQRDEGAQVHGGIAVA